MSLVIHTIVRDGIVVSADTRTTCKDGKGNTRYDDTAEKIIPFPNRIVVTHTGDTMINDTLSVTDFLIGLRRQWGKKTTITDLPVKLLNEYLSKCGNRIAKTYFKVSGYDEIGMLGGRTYSINGEEKTITLSRQPFNYGVSLGGTTDVAFAMMSIADYSNMSLKDAIDLTESTLSSNIITYKYAPSQIIGGNVQTYVIDVVNDISGWLINNTITPDSNAPNDGIVQYREQQAKKFMQQISKQKNKKGTKRK